MQFQCVLKNLWITDFITCGLLAHAIRFNIQKQKLSIYAKSSIGNELILFTLKVQSYGLIIIV